MAEINYRNDKFIPTPLPVVCAPRKALLDLYDEATKKRFAVVCAPAGYGKTMSTLLWMKASGRKSIWIGLDEYDNAPFVFYRLFCTGIMSAQPDNEKIEALLNSNSFYSSPVEFTISLLMEFAPEDAHYALILDDFHTITNRKILKSLPFILKRMPHSFDILILSRNKLPVELQDFAEQQGSMEITANELVFSTEEIQKYFIMLGRYITRKQAQTMFDVTGGWIIGINVLSQSESLSVPDMVGQLDQYMNRNIWEKWDEQLKDFMLITCTADEMDAELCRTLTGLNNAEEILSELLNRNLFAMKTARHTYRYHYLFLEYLRSKQQERLDIDTGSLTQKVAGFYYDREDYFTALSYYVRNQDHEGITKCFYQLNAMYLDFSVEEWINYTTVFVLERLPEDFIQKNVSLLIEASWAYYLNGNAGATLKYINLTREYIMTGDHLDKMVEQDLLGFACTVAFADFRKNLCELTQDFAVWIDNFPSLELDMLNMYTPSITQNFPFIHRSLNDCLDFIPDVDRSLRPIEAVFGTIYAKDVDVFCACIRAGLYYEQNQIDRAYDTITQAQCDLKKENRFEIQFGVFTLLSQIQIARGRDAEAADIRTYFAGRITEEKALYINPNFLAVDTKHRLWDADREAAEGWLAQFFVTEDEQLRFLKLYQYFTTVRALIVLSEKDKAVRLLEKLKKLCTDYRRPLDIAEAGVLSSSLEWACGEQEKAVQTLETVLIAMQTFGAIRIISDEGAAVLPVLKKLSVKVKGVKEKTLIDLRYLTQVQICAYETAQRHKGITASLSLKPVKLSKQQKYILSLLAQGYRNAEIVGMTGLSINTVKAHTKLAYTKLGVGKAEDAIITAKELGLIEA